MSAVEGAPRLTPTQRLHEVTMAAMQRRVAEPESSVTLTRNARGVVQFEVTVRGPIPRLAKQTAEEIFQELDASYPYPVSTNGDAV